MSETPPGSTIGTTADDSPELALKGATATPRVVGYVEATGEVEARILAILERIERELPAVERRTERLMHRYGL